MHESVTVESMDESDVENARQRVEEKREDRRES